METNNIVKLEADDGREVEFEVADMIEFNQKTYACLLPLETDEVVILEVDTSNEEYDSYKTVEDEAIMNAIFEEFKVRHKDEFEFD